MQTLFLFLNSQKSYIHIQIPILLFRISPVVETAPAAEPAVVDVEVVEKSEEKV